MKAIEWLEKTYGIENSEYPVRPYVFCKDGYGISIQGGDAGKYCNPREKCNTYYSVELGFPNKADDIIYHMAENPEDLTKTIYGYVPIETVEDLIAKHGGIDFELSISKHIAKYKDSDQSTAYSILLKKD